MKDSDIKTNTAQEPVVITESSRMPSDAEMKRFGELFKKHYLPIFEKLAAE